MHASSVPVRYVIDKMQVQRLKSRVFDILEYKSEDCITRLVGVFFTILITLNIAEIILMTVEALSR